mgnify:CR=1 FL=1
MIKENLVLFLNTIQDLNHRTASKIKFRSERYAVHCSLGVVIRRKFVVGYDDAREKLSVDVYPCVFRH